MKAKRKDSAAAVPAVATAKLGDDSGELAHKPRHLDQNFAQSCDLHESRGTIQSHRAAPKGERVRNRPTVTRVIQPQ